MMNLSLCAIVYKVLEKLKEIENILKVRILNFKESVIKYLFEIFLLIF